jgi:hypothetical protein
MKIDEEGEYTIVSNDNTALAPFLDALSESHNNLKNENLIVNLLSMKEVKAADLYKFIDLSKEHRAGNRSFVIVTNRVAYDELPDELQVVPTLQEAKDLIEMEEIERDLGL